jgi:hypothetical protein
MARLIQLTAAHAGPTNAKVWLNADKIVKLEEKKGDGTRIHHEPYDQETQSLDYTDVEEEPWEVAKAAHQPIVIDGTICTTTP